MIYHRRFHILTPNITATIILTLGKITPITIWPVVLRPPLLPLPFIGDGDGDGDVDVDDNEFEEEDADEVEFNVVARELGEVSRGMDETAVFGDDGMLDEDELGEGVIDENVLDCWDVCELGVALLLLAEPPATG